LLPPPTLTERLLRIKSPSLLVKSPPSLPSKRLLRPRSRTWRSTETTLPTSEELLRRLPMPDSKLKT
jgi:hypothetical protein